MGEVVAGRYELLVPLATGGMGTVWMVRDLAIGAAGEAGGVCAAKILRQSDAGALLRFVREQSVRIDHAHVVTPLSWAGMDDRVLFTMPLVRGGSVADLLRDHGALPTGWVAALLDQLLLALEAVHASGVVHRDVKPANLLLDPFTPGTPGARPHLRLTDFGIAVPVDEPRMTRASVVIGTPGYMAPEQWHGADPDPRADLYAAGRVGQELLTGQRPRAEQPPAAWTDLATGDPARDALARVVLALLAHDPAHRPAGATAARAELARRGLVDLPVEGSVAVPDRVGPDVPAPLPSAPPAGPPPAGPPPVGPPTSPPTTRPAATPGETPTVRADPATAVWTPDPTAVAPVDGPRRRPSLLPALVLLVLGALALAGAAWLLLG